LGNIVYEQLPIHILRFEFAIHVGVFLIVLIISKKQCTTYVKMVCV